MTKSVAETCRRHAICIISDNPTCLYAFVGYVTTSNQLNAWSWNYLKVTNTLGPNIWSQISNSTPNLFWIWRFCPHMTGIDELHFTGKAQRCMLVQQPLWQVSETGYLAVLLQALSTAVPQLPEFRRQLLAVVLGSSTERIAIIFATNRFREKNNARSDGAQYWRDYLHKMKIILWLTNITFKHLAVFTIHMGIIAISLIAKSLQWLATGSGVRMPVMGGGQIFRIHSDRLNQPPIKWVPGLFPDSKAAGAWRSPPIPF